MKTFCAAVIVFALSLVFVAIWYSPLVGAGDVFVYENNESTGRVVGVCYPADAVCRAEMSGGETELYAALERMSANVVYVTEAGDRIIVYAYSPRVVCDCLTASNGEMYNVMAACGGGSVVIGTPVLQGSY